MESQAKKRHEWILIQLFINFVGELLPILCVNRTSPTDTQRSVFKENAFNKYKKPVTFIRKTIICLSDSFSVSENKDKV